MAQPPEPPPEARLLARKRRARRLSVGQAAELTGYSASTYRQTENGYHVPARGLYVAKTAPAETLARMLHALGATPRELIDADRADAAEILEGLIEEDAATAAAPVSHDAEEAQIRAAVALVAGQGVTDPAGADLFADEADARSWDALALAGHPVNERILIIARMRKLRSPSPSGQVSGTA